MSEKNQKRGVPKGFNGRLVKADFPVERPIFWAGNQNTLFPNDYVEPDPLKNNLMKIPLVVRFIVGGAPAEVNIDRLIYLGYAKLRRMVIVFRDTACTPMTTALGGFYARKNAISVVHEISTEFGANLTTLQAIALNTETALCVKEDYGQGPFQQAAFNELGQYTWNTTKWQYDCPFDIPGPNTAPGFDPWTSGTVDVGALPIEVASPFTTAVANPHTLYGYLGQLHSVHYFLRNYINNSIQINTIYIYFNLATDTQLANPETITLANLSFGKNVSSSLELDP